MSFKTKFFLVLSLFSISAFAGGTVGTLFDGSELSKIIPDMLATPIDLVEKFMSNVRDGNKNLLLTVFGTLFILESIYTFSKHYVEGNYHGLPATLITRCFFGAVFLTFLQGGYYFTIPQEVVQNMFGHSTSIDLSNPLVTSKTMLQTICNPWATFAAAWWKPAAIAYDAMGWSDGFAVLGQMFLLLFGVLVILIGWFIVAQICFTYVMKLIEISIGLSVIIFFLALKGSKATENYFDTALKYIVTACIDLGIIALVCSLGASILLEASAGAGLGSLFGGLFGLIIWATLFKVSTKIGAGIASGSPKVTFADSSAILQSAVQVGGSLAIGTAAVGGAAAMGVGAVAGAGIGGLSAATNGGNIAKGIASGVISGGSKGISMGKKAVGAANKASKAGASANMAASSGNY